MKSFLHLAVLCLAAQALAQGQDQGQKEAGAEDRLAEVVVPEKEAAENDQVFVTNVVDPAGADSEGKGKGKGRTRRSVPVGAIDLDLAGPLGAYGQYAEGFRNVRPFSDYSIRPYADFAAAGRRTVYRRPESYGLLNTVLRAPEAFRPSGEVHYGGYDGLGAGTGAYYAASAGSISRTQSLGAGAGVYYGDSTDGTQWSFVNFYNSFRPLQAVKTTDNTFVRNYVRIGSFDDCLSDFWRLQLTEVHSVSSSAFVKDYDYGLLGGVSAAPSAYFADVARDTIVGYVGVMRDHPYRVLALKSGCQLDGFSGYHDCIVFSGATYPYDSTVRRFVYVREQYAAPVLQTVYGPSAVEAVYPAAAYGNVHTLGGYKYGNAQGFGGYNYGNVRVPLLQ